tara:strand:+ start:166 stop:387 length:222 start_codon:yes stop_codon:yes gene_type:complete
MKMSAFFRSQKCDLRLLLVSRSNWSKFQNSENRRAYCDAREEEEEEDILSQQHQNNKKKISKKKSHTKNTPIF